MTKLLTAFAAIVLFTSCQKEISLDPGNTAVVGSGTNTGNTSGLLVKTVAVTGSETQTTLYTYDAQKRLETIAISGTSGGMPVDSYQKFVRDAAGRIVKVLQKLADQPGTTSDTAVKTFYYPDATTMNYAYSTSVISMTMGGFTMSTVDSSVYSYTGGKMNSYNSYLSSSVMPGTVMLNSRYDFVYDASNRVSDMKVYTDVANPGGAMSLDAQWTYAYSTSTINNAYVSPSAAQNFALNGLPNTSTNVITKTTTASASTSPPTNVTITLTYVTGNGNKPVSGTAVVVSTGQPTQTTNYTFYYQ